MYFGTDFEIKINTQDGYKFDRPRAAATPKPIKIRAETVRQGKYAPAAGELVFTPGVADVKVVSRGTGGSADDSRLRQVEAQQREFEAKE